MRIALTLALSICCISAMAQAVLVPGSTAIQQKWISSDITQMNWYVMKGNERLLIGNVFTQFSKKEKQLMMMREFGYLTMTSPMLVLISFSPW